MTNRVTKKCKLESCNNTLKRNSMTFCSRKCMGAYTTELRGTSVCLYCKRPFKITHARQKYCSNSCYKLGMKELKQIKHHCPQCGIYSYDIDSRQICCSAVCARVYDSIIRGTEYRSCLECGKDFKLIKARQDLKLGGNFCSMPCYRKYRKEHPDIYVKNKSEITYYRCSNCGKIFNAYSNTRMYSKKYFCSVACMVDYNHKNNIGIWNNGKFIFNGTEKVSRGNNWGGAKSYVRRRDEYKCKLCGSVEDKDTLLTVHHIIPYSIFNDDYIVANQVSNLITLCDKCHIKIHKHPNTRGDFEGLTPLEYKNKILVNLCSKYSILNDWVTNHPIEL